MKVRSLTPFFVLLFLAVVCHQASAREWTDIEGRKLEAEFVGLDGDKVVLKIKKKMVRVLLAKFSKEDQKFVRKQTATALEEVTPVFDVPSHVPNLEKIRRWTSRDGKKIRAAFIMIDDDKVQLQLKTGPESIPFEKFSDADQRNIRYYLESLGRGYTVPRRSGDLPRQSVRSWKDQKGKQIQGTLRRVEAGGMVVIQLANATGSFPFKIFSESDQDFVRTEVSSRSKMATFLPEDKAIRTWTDWTGKEFTAKIGQTAFANGNWRQLRFWSGRKTFTKNFLELSEADRKYLRQLAEETSVSSRLPPSFVEPTAEVRQWKAHGKTLAGKFVKLAGDRVTLRTSSDPNRVYSLDAIEKEDRKYVADLMTERGQADRVPLVKSDCHEFRYGPSGVEIKFHAVFVEVKQGIVTVQLAERPNFFGRPLRKKDTVPYFCLDAASQQYVRDQMPTGTPSEAYNVMLSNAPTDSPYDWTQRDGKKFTDVKLIYVDGNRIALGDRERQVWIFFKNLIPADQVHARRVVQSRGGIAAFRKSTSPSPTNTPQDQAGPNGRGWNPNVTPPPAPNIPQLSPDMLMPRSKPQKRNFGGTRTCQRCRKLVDSSGDCPVCGASRNSGSVGSDAAGSVLAGVGTVFFIVLAVGIRLVWYYYLFGQR